MTSGIEAAPIDPAAETNWLSTGWAAVQARWWLVLGIALVASVAAIVYLRNADYLYSATLKIAPAPSTQQHEGLGGLSGLASLAGVGGVEAEPASPFRLYLEGIYAPEVADAIARHPDVMHVVFVREWDPERRVWRPKPGRLAGLRDAISDLVGAPVAPWHPPGTEDLRNFIIDRVVAGQSVKSPLATVSFDATDPAFAVHFLDLLDRADDDYLRAKALVRSRQDVAYLTEKLAMVTLAEHRLVLSAQLSEAERKLMAASNPSPYAADRFGRITVSAQPTHPKAIAVLVGAILAGLVAGVAVAVALARRRPLV